ncbi:hypothetical protein AB833_02940 [Chromatiales bacterium (ex Bugula neritina AB1)]|nr:hypothetical protein AB833_02940 [Chromatiales bacterium (ex Bugula neritina AB1)]
MHVSGIDPGGRRQQVKQVHRTRDQPDSELKSKYSRRISLPRKDELDFSFNIKLKMIFKLFLNQVLHWLKVASYYSLVAQIIVFENNSRQIPNHSGKTTNQFSFEKPFHNRFLTIWTMQRI